MMIGVHDAAHGFAAKLIMFFRHVREHILLAIDCSEALLLTLQF